jgi:hypothetical protein
METTEPKDVAVRESFEEPDGDSYFTDLQLVLTDLACEKPEVLEELIEEIKLIHLVRSAESRIEFGDIADVGLARREYSHKLGKSPLPNEHRIHKHGRFDYRNEARSCETTVFIKFTHPTLDRYLNDAITCCAIGALASVITAVAAGNVAGGYAIFYPAWRLCMIAKVGESVVRDFRIEFFGQKRCGCWEYHDEPSCRL